MSLQGLRTYALTQGLVVTISRDFESGGVPSVLWGNFLLTVYGVPTITSDAAFAVPDDKIKIAQEILCKADLDVCQDEHCVVVENFSSPPPFCHFHLERQDLHISLYQQSQVLPNIADMKSAAHVISASDERLPGPRLGFGNGAFLPKHNSVRVPSAECFTQACILNFARYARKRDPWCPFDMHFLSWVSYMVEYVYPGGYLNIESLPDPFKEFLVDAFLVGTTDSFVAARAKLLESDV